jgi:hypothetical protein
MDQRGASEIPLGAFAGDRRAAGDDLNAGGTTVNAVVTGLIGSYPLAGMTFHYVQYLLGLRSLGWNVFYIEDTGRWVYEPVESTFSDKPDHNVSYLQQAMGRFGLGDAWCFRDPVGRWHGPLANSLAAQLKGVDLFLNVSGSCWLRPEYRASRNIVYIDTDPGYTQFKVAKACHGEADDDIRYSVERMAEHDFHATFAENIGGEDCAVPTDLFEWIPTRQPISLELWRVEPRTGPVNFTTVMSWRPYAEPFRYGDRQFWGKEKEFEKVLDLPVATGAHFELASSGEAPEDLLREHGWRIRPAFSVSRSTSAYQRYISSSGGEFTVAKDMYAQTRSGWFSERTACYLASGRPAVVQDTGGRNSSSDGLGLHVFQDSEEAATGIARVMENYQQESRAARAIAEEHFDAQRVLTELLRALGL